MDMIKQNRSNKMIPHIPAKYRTGNPHSHSKRSNWFSFVVITLIVGGWLSITACNPEDVPLSEENVPATQLDQKEWAIALHGGAGTISPDMDEERKQLYYDGLTDALTIGQLVLEEGGTAVEAVVATVQSLENNPVFNAGRGSVFTSEGKHELDAAIMDGRTMEAGALTGLTTVRNPIILARKVMESSPHIFFSGLGAEEFADQTDVERVENDYFSTDERREQFQRAQDRSSTLIEPGWQRDNDLDLNLKYGTVGAVARDREGNLAAGTSTGGMTNKQFGRVGDVPIIGGGTFANQMVAISATGWGEKIMQQVSANTIANLMEFGNHSLEDAMVIMLNERLEPGDAGFIGVDQFGNISMQMNTRGMYRASASSDGERVILIWEDE